MKQLIIKPEGWPTTLLECPPGFFVWQKILCLKSEYRNKDGNIEAFNEAGEFFWGGAKDHKQRDGIEVQPVYIKWIED